MSGRPEVLDLEPSLSFVVPRLWVQRGSRVTRIADYKGRCHYRGVVRNHKMSSVALSTCNGLVSFYNVLSLMNFISRCDRSRKRKSSAIRFDDI